MSDSIKRFTLRIDTGKLKELRVIAAQEDTTINALLISMVDEFLFKRKS